MGRNIPTFSATRAFEATARHGNLQGASNELSISSSAVSHQIKALEMYLGIKLLIRGSSGLELTKIGKTYADDLSHVLNRLETVTLKALNKNQSSQLSINMYQSVADLWLVSQLASFREIHPDIKIKIVTQPEEIDLSGTDVDIAIRYQQGCNTGPQSIFLFSEHLTPVCSPEFFKEHGPFAKVDQLLDQPLIVYSDTSGEWLEYI